MWYQFEQNWTKGTQAKDKNLQMLTKLQNANSLCFAGVDVRDFRVLGILKADLVRVQLR